MANYTVVFADGNNVVVNGSPLTPTTDTTRVVAFWGQGTTNWGQLLMNNFAKLLEHASGSVDPHNAPTRFANRGQIWHRFIGANEHYLKLRGDGVWHDVLVLSSSVTSPINPYNGQMWYDESTSKLKTRINGSWAILGEGVSKLGDTMTGFLTLHSDPSSAMHATTKQYVDTQVSALSSSVTTNYVPKTGATMTGFVTLHLNPSSAMHAATKQYVDTQVSTLPVLKTGSTMTGLLILSAHPTIGSSAFQAATKQYVDSAILSGSGLGYNPVDKAGDTMMGFLNLHADPTLGPHAATKQYTDGFLHKTSGGTVTGVVNFQNTITFTNNVVCSAVPSANNHLVNKLFLDTNFLQKTGGTVTGNVALSATPSLTNHVINIGYANSTYLQLTGGTISGNLAITGVISQSTAPTTAAHLTNKQYVDTTAVLLSGSATITGVKTFSTLPKSPNAPVAVDDIVNKQYVDNAVLTGGGSGVPATGGTFTGLVSSNYTYVPLPIDPTNNSLVTFKVINDRFVRNTNITNQITSTTSYGVLRYTSIDATSAHYDLGDLMPKQAILNLMGEYLLTDGSIPMIGALTLAGAPTLANHAATKQYVDTNITNLTSAVATTYVAKVGGTMTGHLTLNANPTNPLHAATKDYVDDVIAPLAPTGVVEYYLGSTAPAGWLECNGASVSRTTYAALFALFGTTYGSVDGSTFNLPDFRGEFIRSWDHGRGIDTGRTLGSFQTDDIKAHTHTTDVTTSGVGDTNVEDTSASFALYSANGGVTGSTGGTETRPRNVALMVIVKV